MKHKYFLNYIKRHSRLRRDLRQKNFRQSIYKTILVFFILLSTWVLINTITLISASSKSTDAFFVLGGSITREVYVAQLAKQHPQIPILVSKGSQDPCILLIFRKKAASLQNVWLEKCANSTFDNFYYGIPVFRNWNSRKIKLITSPTHLPRAKWMAQILFGTHGIWVETEVVTEKGVPGNQEHWLKTGLDIIRSILWAILSHVIQPQCPKIINLADVNMKDWLAKGFQCEHQENLNISSPKLKTVR
ncbi:MAG: ElyC/SanA/YdcF family protein [Cyanobacteria bacterium P01_A01_bin.84]